MNCLSVEQAITWSKINTSNSSRRENNQSVHYKRNEQEKMVTEIWSNAIHLDQQWVHVIGDWQTHPWEGPYGCARPWKQHPPMCSGKKKRKCAAHAITQGAKLGKEEFNEEYKHPYQNRQSQKRTGGKCGHKAQGRWERTDQPAYWGKMCWQETLSQGYSVEQLLHRSSGVDVHGWFLHWNYQLQQPTVNKPNQLPEERANTDWGGRYERLRFSICRIAPQEWSANYLLGRDGFTIHFFVP